MKLTGWPLIACLIFLVHSCAMISLLDRCADRLSDVNTSLQQNGQIEAMAVEQLIEINNNQKIHFERQKSEWARWSGQHPADRIRPGYKPSRFDDDRDDRDDRWEPVPWGQGDPHADDEPTGSREPLGQPPEPTPAEETDE